MLRSPKFWVTALVVLVALFFAADRGGKYFVEGLVQDEVQKSLATPDKPSVKISGFPFLTQLVSQKFDDVEVDIRDADAGQIRVEQVHAVLTGVERAGDGVRVESIAGDGRIAYAEATRAADPFAVSYGGPGLVKITGKVSFAGQSRTASATGKPRIAGNKLIIKPEQVTVDGTAAPVAGLVPDITYPLREIPKGLRITINPTEAGIGFSFDGENLQLSSQDITASWGVSPVPAREVTYARPVA